MPEAVLFSQMQPAPEWEAEFNDWYDTEHVPVRLAIDGFSGACRYTAVKAAVKYAVAYYLRDLAVLQTPEYGVVKNQPSERTRWMLNHVTGFTRYTAVETARFARPDRSPDQLAAPYLYPVLFAVPEERAADFDAWYNEDHCPLLLQNPHWWQIRRYKIVSGEPSQWTHLALHYLGDLSALESPERERARQSPWRARLAAEPWFKGEYGVYQRLQPQW